MTTSRRDFWCANNLALLYNAYNEVAFRKLSLEIRRMNRNYLAMVARMDAGDYG